MKQTVKHYIIVVFDIHRNDEGNIYVNFNVLIMHKALHAYKMSWYKGLKIAMEIFKCLDQMLSYILLQNLLIMHKCYVNSHSMHENSKCSSL